MHYTKLCNCSAMGISLPNFGGLKNHAILRGAVKSTSATAQNRSVLVHSILDWSPLGHWSKNRSTERGCFQKSHLVVFVVPRHTGIYGNKESKGQMNRGNRTESLWEGNLPLRGSLRGRPFRGFQRSSEVFRGFQRFSEIFRGFQRSSQRPSQRQTSLSEALSPVAPNRAAPWTFSNWSIKKGGLFQIFILWFLWFPRFSWFPVCKTNHPNIPRNYRFLSLVVVECVLSFPNSPTSPKESVHGVFQNGGLSFLGRWDSPTPC